MTIGLVGGFRLANDLVPVRGNVDRYMLARIDGRITQVKSISTTGYRYVIQGEVDAKLLPCVRTSILVTEFNSDSTLLGPHIGETRVVFARIHRPDAATLPGEVSEVDICRAFHVSFVADRARSYITSEPLFSDRWLTSARTWIRTSLDDALPPNVAGIALALVIGDQQGIDRTSREAYAASGTAHMFSVSGSHVGVVIIIMLTCIGMAPSWWRVCVMTAAIAGFVWLSGWEPPAVRAGVIGVMALYARRTERPIDLRNLLAGTVLLMLCVQPQLIQSVGAILSVAAMASIVTLAPVWRSRMTMWIGSKRNWKQTLVSSLALTLAATVGVSLPSMLTFETTSLTAPLANLFVVPLLSVALVLSLMILVGSCIGYILPFAWCCSLCINAADLIATTLADSSMKGLTSEYKWLVFVVFMLVILWPICSPFSRSFLSYTVRQGLGIVALGVVVHILPHQPIQSIVAERRGGTVLIARRSDTILVLVTGKGLAPLDNGVRAWCKKQELPVRCEGFGIWGRRLSAAVRNDVVGLSHDLSRTRIR